VAKISKCHLSSSGYGSFFSGVFWHMLKQREIEIAVTSYDQPVLCSKANFSTCWSQAISAARTLNLCIKNIKDEAS
jgi:hypothetical protein